MNWNPWSDASLGPGWVLVWWITLSVFYVNGQRWVWTESYLSNHDRDLGAFAIRCDQQPTPATHTWGRP